MQFSNERFFTPIETVKKSQCSHEIVKGYLEQPEELWFCKTSTDKIRAQYEVLAQELHRLFIENHPQTYLMQNKDSDQYFVFSKEVPGFKSISFQKQDRLINGVYTGLGSILIMALFLYDVDLNTNNIGINLSNEFIKIDGDWAFSELIRPDLFVGKRTEITLELLDALPYVINYDVENWLDIVQLGKPCVSELVSEKIRSSAHFIEEINSTVLKIILTPTDYFRRFIDLYIPENSDNILSFLLKRSEQLKQCMLQNPRFIQFLASDKARDIMNSHLFRIRMFNTIDGKQPYQDLDAIESKNIYSAIRKIGYLMPHMNQTNYWMSPDEVYEFRDLEEQEGQDVMNFTLFSKSKSSLSRTESDQMSSPSSNSRSSSSLRLNRTFSNLSILS